MLVGASAQNPATVWFDNRQITFHHPVVRKDDIAVALHDPAVQALLARVGASVAWQPGERYILVTTAEPHIVTFAIGEVRYDLADVSSSARFAPFLKDGDVYLPLRALAHALYLEPKDDRGQIVLQPQIAVADVQSQRDVSQLVLHGALPLAPRKISSSGGRIVYDFPGLGSTLERSRKVRAGSLWEIDVEMGGTTRNPDTKITLVLARGANLADGVSGNYHDFTVALSAGAAPHRVPPPPPSMAQSAPPSAEPAPGEIDSQQTPAPSPAASAAAVTAVDAVQNGTVFAVQIAVNGSAAYEWHRLLDNRWYVDIHGAWLQAAAGDRAQSSPSVSSLRVHQLSNDTVRVALTLTGEKPVNVTPSDHGLDISVQEEDATGVVRSGSGQIGAGAVANVPVQPGQNAPGTWKYAPAPEAPASANSRLIVLDPGHGGSDAGAARSEVVEKKVNLDISQRLRDILVARGWQVTMTRDSDKDVYAPNDGAREELQARCDAANNAGARLFVSVHANTAGSSSVSGSTFYYSKSVDVPLARAIERRVIAESGTNDDGVQKSKFYVTLHTTMPAVLIETAFMTNPGDYRRLLSNDWRQRMAQAIADGIGDYASPGSPSQTSQRR
ncbi:MAG: N-acetylmuramoyl-L-alanine amidase family protein [Candidatus Eremiobacteraeota bacterium]|nr:N-acetylmuramoyl-L-alanine amidase family protein [Candidatus Eremiobacteraeota bacterium]